MIRTNMEENGDKELREIIELLNGIFGETDNIEEKRNREIYAKAIVLLNDEDERVVALY